MEKSKYGTHLQQSGKRVKGEKGNSYLTDGFSSLICLPPYCGTVSLFILIPKPSTRIKQIL